MTFVNGYQSKICYKSNSIIYIISKMEFVLTRYNVILCFVYFVCVCIN